jgi:hypothetical protein
VTKIFHKRAAVARRYSTSRRNTYRMEADGRLPPPDMYMGAHALWSEETLEANEQRRAALLPPASNRAIIDRKAGQRKTASL